MTPAGLSATLAGVTYCPAATLAGISAAPYGLAEMASPSCPASSRIGASSTAAGAGDHPVHLPGTVYLSGPYKGAPLSLAVVTPAVSGPYDLGNVVVRAAVQVDPTTARLTAISDPLPQIVGGIPLRLREVLVNLDRPDFMINPTNCDRFAVGTRIFGDQGAVADPSVPFQVANCSELPFGPRLALKLRGGNKRTQNPALSTTLTAGPGEANIAKAVVDDASRPAPRQQPHRQPLHQTRVRRRQLPGRLGAGNREGGVAAAREAARGHGLPGHRLRAQAARRRRRPQRARSTSTSTASSAAARRAPCAPASRRCPTCRSPASA